MVIPLIMMISPILGFKPRGEKFAWQSLLLKMIKWFYMVFTDGCKCIRILNLKTPTERELKPIGPKSSSKSHFLLYHQRGARLQKCNHQGTLYQSRSTPPSRGIFSCKRDKWPFSPRKSLLKMFREAKAQDPELLNQLNCS